MKWNEFKKGKKSMEIEIVKYNFEFKIKMREIVKGYPFESLTFIVKERNSNYWRIVDLKTGNVVGGFNKFANLIGEWESGLKDRLEAFRKTNTYKRMVEEMARVGINNQRHKDLEEKKDEN